MFSISKFLGIEFVTGKGRPTMEWSSRLKIAVGSAKGLSYLHENCKSIRSCVINIGHGIIPYLFLKINKYIARSCLFTR